MSDMAAEGNCDVCDYSSKGLKKINKATENEAKCLVTLILDDNELQRLECIDSYLRLENLSVAKNSLLRMYGVGRLVNLRELNLSNNSILTIEGLKELVYLKKLRLSGNNIKSIEQLNNNINLEYLDLSDNQISHISDISYLKNLKYLLLEKNRIGNLRQCERYLPSSITFFGVANNFITDLNTLCHISHLNNLENFSLEGNPCVNPNDEEKLNYDYRPFVINWAMSIKVLDGYEVNAIESLKAEWLYSQGRGRQFREGEHLQLIQYLATTCPSGAAAPETEEQRKLRLILSKAQHHQQQLREQGPSSPRLKQSPRMHARITGRVTKSPDRSMSSSFHSALSNKHHNLLNQQSSQMSASFSGEIPLNTTPVKLNTLKMENSLMSQSFDSSNLPMITDAPDNKLLDKQENYELKSKEVVKVNETNTSYTDTNKINQPLEAASKMVPVPDSMMSPDYQGPMFVPHPAVISNKRNISVSNYQVTSKLSQSSVSISHCESPNLSRSGKPKPTTVVIAKTISPYVKNNKGSPQLPRSAMSSPKMKHCIEKRKGSFSARPVPNPNSEELNLQSLKCITNSNSNINFPKVNSPSSKLSKVNNKNTAEVNNRDTNNSSDDDSEMCIEKLQSIRDAANQRRKKQSVSDSGSSENVATTNISTTSKSKCAYNAAVTIQKLWRGYRTRNLNQKTGSILHSIQTMRARQYIEKLTNDVEATKTALDSERKIQQLQMQAINALWKKVSAMENDSKSKSGEEKNNDKDPKDLAVRELTQTCSMLQAQVQQLQGSMRDLLQFVAHRNNIPMEQWGDGIATQTDITAVHTPQGETAAYWPFQKMASRPCTLLLSVQNSNFNQGCVNGVEKRDVAVNETNSELLPGQTDACVGEDEVPIKEKNKLLEKTDSDGNGDVKPINGCYEDKLSEELVNDCLGNNNSEIENKELDITRS